MDNLFSSVVLVLSWINVISADSSDAAYHEIHVPVGQRGRARGGGIGPRSANGRGQYEDAKYKND